MWSCIAHSKYVGSVYYNICKALSLTIELAICVVPVACWIYLCISWLYVKIMHKYTPQCEGLIYVNNFFKCFLKAWDKNTPPGVYKERGNCTMWRKVFVMTVLVEGWAPRVVCHTQQSSWDLPSSILYKSGLVEGSNNDACTQAKH